MLDTRKVVGCTLVVLLASSYFLLDNQDNKESASTSRPQNSNIELSQQSHENQSDLNTITLTSSSNAKTPKANIQSSDFQSKKTNLKYSEKSETIKLQQRVEEMSARRVEKNFDIEEVKEAMKQTSAWTISRDSGTSLPLEESEKTDGRYFIETNPLRIEALMIGDKLPLNIPHTDQDYTLSVEKIIAKRKTVQWRGTIDGIKGGTFNITRGNTLTTGRVKTPEGGYEFRFFNNQGWIHSSDQLFKFDENVSDSITPEVAK